MAARWTHVTITVSDLDRSIDFYRSVCGLEVVRDRRAEGASTAWMGYAPAPGRDPEFVLVLLPGEVTDPLDPLGSRCDPAEGVAAGAREGERLDILVRPPTDSGGS